MSSEQPQQPETTTTTALATTTPSTSLVNRSSSLRSPYSSSLYSGGGLYNRGGYGMGGMGMGMGMGMGGMGMGMNRFGQNPQQNGNRGLQQEYQQVFQGLKAVLQMGFSAFGLYTYGKMFGSMMIKIVKFGLRKSKDAGKAILAWTVFNTYSTKVLNGIFTRARRSNGGIFNLVFKALLSVGILGIALVWFLIKSSDLEVEEEEILRRLSKRKEIKQKKMREFEECNFIFYFFFSIFFFEKLFDDVIFIFFSDYENLHKQVEDAIQKEKEAEEIFEEAIQEEEEGEDETESTEEMSEENSKEEKSEELDNEKIIKENFPKKKEKSEKSEEDKIERKLQKEKKEKTTSEEFWMKKESELEKQLKVIEEGDALNKLFGDDDDSFDFPPKKITKEESEKIENEILLSWPEIPTPKQQENTPEPEEEEIVVVLNKSPSLEKIEEEPKKEEDDKKELDLGSIFEKVPMKAKKPWLR